MWDLCEGTGLFHHGEERVCIAKLSSSLSLQGHEDLRQDERVMQLFGLVNAMLSNDRSTAERDLSIARYAVIPLSPNSGQPNGMEAFQMRMHTQTIIKLFFHEDLGRQTMTVPILRADKYSGQQ